tara:strand:- start:3258 stop:3536 length:279 start_codon:yes stop_codon:yes gene_type:complete
MPEEITIHAWGKVATVTVPDDLVGVGPQSFVRLAAEDEVPEGMTDEEFAIKKVIGFVVDTIKAATAKEAARDAADTVYFVEQQTDQITLELE